MRPGRQRRRAGTSARQRSCCRGMGGLARTRRTGRGPSAKSGRTTTACSTCSATPWSGVRNPAFSICQAQAAGRLTTANWRRPCLQNRCASSAVSPMASPMNIRRRRAPSPAAGEAGWSSAMAKPDAEIMNSPSPAASITYSGQWRFIASVMARDTTLRLGLTVREPLSG